MDIGPGVPGAAYDMAAYPSRFEADRDQIGYFLSVLRNLRDRVDPAFVFPYITYACRLLLEEHNAPERLDDTIEAFEAVMDAMDEMRNCHLGIEESDIVVRDIA